MSASLTRASLTRTQKSRRQDKIGPSRATTSRVPTVPPPKGLKPLTETLENETFNWDSVEENPNLELWALHPKSVDGLTMVLPSSLPARSTIPLAHFEAGRSPKGTYEVRMSGEHTGGAEMSEFSCLLPRDDGYLGLASKPITTHLLVAQTHALPTPAASPDASQSTSSSGVPPLPLPSSQRYVHPDHLLKGRFIPTGGIPSGSKPNAVEMLLEVSDSEASANEGPTKRAAPPTARRSRRADVPRPSVSPARKMAAASITTAKNLRKRKVEPVIGGDGKAPKRRKKVE